MQDALSTSLCTGDPEGRSIDHLGPHSLLEEAGTPCRGFIGGCQRVCLLVMLE